MKGPSATPHDPDAPVARISIRAAAVMLSLAAIPGSLQPAGRFGHDGSPTSHGHARSDSHLDADPLCHRHADAYAIRDGHAVSGANSGAAGDPRCLAYGRAVTGAGDVTNYSANADGSGAADRLPS